jgi:hypothetical protein
MKTKPEIQQAHFTTMEELNEHLRIFEKEYNCEIKIISIHSTPSGFDIFYTIK